MDKLIRKITSIGVLIIAAVAGLASLYFVLIKDANTEFMGSLDLTFYITYAMIVLVIAAIVFFAIFQILNDKKQIVKTLILLAIVAVVVIVAYFLAPVELSNLALRLEVSPTAYKWVGTALNVTYITFLGVMAAFLGTILYVKIKN